MLGYRSSRAGTRCAPREGERRHVAPPVVNRVAGFLVGFLLACSTGGPARTPPPAPVGGGSPHPWRGAVVTGADPGYGLRLLEAAWRMTPGDWEPRGWTIVLHRDWMPCGEAICELSPCPAGRLCRGLTRAGRRIDVALDVLAMEWELGNARRLDLTGRLEDRGCCAL